jgi:hypothetical protein
MIISTNYNHNISFPIIELVDRYIISELKFEKTGANINEYNFYKKQMLALDILLIHSHLSDLKKIHQQIWELEYLLKSGHEEQLELAEIGRRAIEIRNLNRKRIQLKNLMADILNDPVKEIKQEHLSE